MNAALVDLVKNVNQPLFIAIAIAFLGLISMLAILLQAISVRMRDKYSNELHRVVLSDLRQSYESQIANLSKQLTATEERWKEVNHLVVAGQQRAPQANGEAERVAFLTKMGFTDSDFEVDPKFVFVLTPFSSEERHTFDVIQKACQEAGYRCARGDEDFTRSEILTHVLKQMITARVVIANISTRNPNVFYELGIAHSIGKPTILVSKRLTEVPFDVRHRQVLMFDGEEQLQRDLMTSLLRAVSETRS